MPAVDLTRAYGFRVRPATGAEVGGVERAALRAGVATGHEPAYTQAWTVERCLGHRVDTVAVVRYVKDANALCGRLDAEVDVHETFMRMSLLARPGVSIL